MPVGIKAKIDLNSVNEVRKNHKDLLKELQELSNNNPIQIKINDTSSQFNVLNNNIKELNNNFKQVTSSNNNFSNSMGNTIATLGKTTLAVLGVKGVVGELKDSFNTFKDIDSQIAMVSSITGMEKSKLNESAKEWNKHAEDMKVPTKEYVSSIQEYLRAGRDINESESLTKTNVMLAKLAGESNESIAKKMVKVSEAFELNTESARRFADQVAYTDTTTAASTQGLLSSATRIAEISKQSDMSKEYMLSTLATIQEVSGKSAESTSRAVKSILENIFKVTKATDEEGKKSISKIESVLTKQNIAIRKSPTEFKSAEEILRSIASQWDKMDKLTQRVIIQQLAGKNFSEEFNVMMESQNKILKLNGELKEKNGDIEGKYAKAIDNVADSQVALKDKLDGLWLSFKSSEIVRDVVGKLGHLVDMLKELSVESPKTGLALAIMAGSFLVLVKNFTAVTSMSGNIIAFFKLLPIALAETGGLATLCSTAFGGLIATLSTLLLNPVTWVIIALGVAIAGTVYSIHKATQEHEQYNQELKETKENADNLRKSIQDLNKEGMQSGIDKMEKDFNKLEELKKKEADLSKKMQEMVKNGQNMRMNPDFDRVVADLQTTQSEISKLNKKMQEGGESVELYKEAQQRLLQVRVADAIKEQTQEEFRHKDSIDNIKNSVIPLMNEYENLNNTQDRNAEQTARMSQLATLLHEKIGAETVAIDENGNVILANNDLISSNCQMLNTEGVTITSLTQLRLDMAKQNAMVQANMTQDTYNNVVSRIKLMRAEFDSVGTQAEKLREQWKAGTISEIDRKQLESMDRYLMSRGSTIVNWEEALRKTNEIYSANKNNQSNIDVQSTRNHFPTDLGEAYKVKKQKEDKQQVQDYKAKINVNKDYELQLEKVNNELSKNKELEENLIGDELINKRKEDLELLRQKATLQDYINENNKKALGASNNLLSQFGFKIENGQIVNRNERLLELQNETNWLKDDEKKKHSEILKQIEQELSVNDEKNQAISKYNQEHKNTENEALKVREIIRDTVLELNNEPLKGLNKDVGNLQDKLANINVNEKEALDTQIDKLRNKEELNQKLLKNSEEQARIAKKNIEFLEKELETAQANSKEYENINVKIDEQNDKLRDLTQQQLNYSKAIRENANLEYNKIIESAIFGSGGYEQVEREYKDKIEQLEEQIKNMEKDDAIKKEEEDRANKLKEIEDLERKINIIKNNNILSLSEEEAGELGLENERERAIQRQQDLEEKRKKFEEERQKRVEEHNKKVLEFEEKMNNLMRNRPIQTFGSANGVWDLRYTQDQEEIDKLKKDMNEENEKFKKESEEKQSDYDKDRIKSEKDYQKEMLKLLDNLNIDFKRKKEEYQRWDRENVRKHEYDMLNEEKDNIQKSLDVQKSFYDEATKLSEIAFSSGNPSSITSIITDAMSHMSEATRSKWQSILKSITINVDKSKDKIDELISKMSKVGDIPSDTGWENPSGGSGNSNSNSGKVLLTEQMWSSIYRKLNPDVDLELKTGINVLGEKSRLTSARQHFIEFGSAEGREAANLFELIGHMVDRDMISFDTGGYTGDWGNEGKLALLHQKELILNEGQTKDMLNMIKISKDFMSNLVSRFNPIVNTPALANIGERMTQNTFQFNNAKFEFPNLTNGDDAEEFYKTLTTNGFVYMNRNQ